jgi:hypothetical protein
MGKVPWVELEGVQTPDPDVVSVLIHSESESEDEIVDPVCAQTQTSDLHGACIDSGDTDDSDNLRTHDSNEESNDVYTQNVILETCAQLLLKLETIHLSILHLQYSVHAGALGSVEVEARDRAKNLWRWKDGGAFSSDIVDQLRLASQSVKDDIETVSGNKDIVDAELLLRDCVYDVFDGGCMENNDATKLQQTDDVTIATDGFIIDVAYNAESRL